MVITQPTIDDFSDTTVMRVIRKIVNYICNDLVDGINNNDIVSGQFSVQGNQLSGTLTKGDGTTIDIPATTLPSGGGGSDNPYPIAVSITLSGTTLNFNMTMSSGTPITGSVNLAPILEGYITDAELQEQISGLKLSTDGNNMTLNGDSVAIVKTVSGQVTDGNLKITINGVESGDIPLPESDLVYISEPKSIQPISFRGAEGSWSIITISNSLNGSKTIYSGFSVPIKIENVSDTAYIENISISTLNFYNKLTVDWINNNYSDLLSMLDDGVYYFTFSAMDSTGYVNLFIAPAGPSSITIFPYMVIVTVTSNQCTALRAHNGSAAVTVINPRADSSYSGTINKLLLCSIWQAKPE